MHSFNFINYLKIKIVGSWNKKTTCEAICWQGDRKEKGRRTSYVSEGNVLHVAVLVTWHFQCLYLGIYICMFTLGTICCSSCPNFGWSTSTSWWQGPYVSHPG